MPDRERDEFKRAWFTMSLRELKERYYVKSVNTLKTFAQTLGLPPKLLTRPNQKENYLLKKYHLSRKQLSRFKEDILNDFLDWIKDSFNEQTPINFKDFMDKFKEWISYKKISLPPVQSQNKRRKRLKELPFGDLCKISKWEGFFIDEEDKD